MIEEWMILASLLFFVVLMCLLLFRSMNQARKLAQSLELAQGKQQAELDLLKQQITAEVTGLKDKVNGDLLLFQGSLTMGMKDDFHRLQEITTLRLGMIEDKVHTSMEKGFHTTYESFTKIVEQIARIDQTQKNLEGLSYQIHDLQAILTDKKQRGTYGEVELYSILELQFGLDERRYQKQYKLGNQKIADAVIFGPQPLGMIAVDAKFPLENYNRMYDAALPKEEQEKARLQFRNDVVIKMKDIAAKYIIPGQTAEFAYMFIPAEAVFAELHGRFEDVIALSYRLRVYIVSPSTFMAYLTAMRALYLGQRRNEKVELLQTEFLKLGVEFQRYEIRWEKLVNDFRKTHQDMQDLSITTDKLLHRFKQLEEVKLEETEEAKA